MPATDETTAPNKVENSVVIMRPYWGPPKQRSHTRKGARDYIAELTDDGRALLHGLARMAAGLDGAGAPQKLDALKYLSDRYWGKTPDTVLNLNANASSEQAEALAAEQLESLIRQIQSSPTLPPAFQVIDGASSATQAVSAAVTHTILADNPTQSHANPSPSATVPLSGGSDDEER